MTKVFLVHEPTRWSIRNRVMEPLDLSPAKEHGELVVVFPGADRPPPAAQGLPELKRVMAGYTAADYLVVAGDMDLLVWAAALALKATGGRVNLLKWDSRGRRYEPVASPDGLLT